MKETKDIINRLNKIQGQIEALKRAVNDSEKDCADVIYQIKAVRGALKKIGDMYTESYINACITKGKSTEKTCSDVAEALKAILKS